MSHKGPYAKWESDQIQDLMVVSSNLTGPTKARMLGIVVAVNRCVEGSIPSLATHKHKQHVQAKHWTL